MQSEIPLVDQGRRFYIIKTTDSLGGRKKTEVRRGEIARFGSYIPETGFTNAEAEIPISGYVVTAKSGGLDGKYPHQITQDLRAGPVGYDDAYIRLERRLAYVIRKGIRRIFSRGSNRQEIS